MSLPKRKRNAVVGITAGLVIAAVTAFKCYHAWVPGQGTLWALLLLPSLPFNGWGCSQLAQDRGYPSSVGYLFLLVALLAAVAIGVTQLPATVGLAFVFVAVCPFFMVLSLPVRFGSMRRGYKG